MCDQGMGKGKKEVDELRKKLKEKEELLAQWTSAAQVTGIAMKRVQETAEKDAQKLKFMDSRAVCRDWQKGRCRRENCRFAHQLPTTRAREDMIEMMGGRNQGQQQPPQQQQRESCPFFEAGRCKFGNECWKEHDPAKYGTRPRSASAGAQTGFQRPSKYRPGGLGGIQEQHPEQHSEQNSEQHSEQHSERSGA